MRSTKFVWLAAIVGVLWGVHPVAASFVATFELGTATISNNVVDIPVLVLWNPAAPNSGYVGIGLVLDVTASSAALSNNGTNYSAWGFSPSSPTSSWPNGFATAGFNNSGVPGAIFLSETTYTSSTELHASPSYQLLGTLTYNLATLGLTSSTSLTVSIMGSDNFGGTALEDVLPSNRNTVNFATTAFNNGSETFPGSGGGTTTAVPAPSALALASIGGVLLTVARLARRSRGGSRKPIS